MYLQIMHQLLTYLSVTLNQKFELDQGVLPSTEHVRFIVTETSGYLQYINSVSRLLASFAYF